MNTEDKKLLIIGLTIAIVIGILAPFFASTNPDGLESTAEKLNPNALESKPFINSIMPDYNIPGLGETPFSGVIAIFIGVIIVFALAYGIGILLKKRS
ncbi:MAG: PDGLE domain-containing protein [Methanobrevibacter sp.]|jgi:cobalt/nickel transport protein|nr:PDGLE domain-containing protein [Candidatus Methanovirga australis]